MILLLEGQKILLNRIPHHANINHWFSNKDLLSVITYSYFDSYCL